MLLLLGSFSTFLGCANFLADTSYIIDTLHVFQTFRLNILQLQC